MGSNKDYDGYDSFAYLDAGEDYEPFELADEHAAGEPYRIPLSDDEAERAERLAATNAVVSLHEHPVYFPADMDEFWEYSRQGRFWTAYDALARTSLDAVFDFGLNGMTRMYSKTGWKWEETVHDIAMRTADLDHQAFAIRGRTVEDIERAREDGTVALIPALESLRMIDNELDRIDILYGLGVRLAGLVYTESNALGSGIGERTDGGLTALGYRAVKRMNKLGMVVSVSHASEKTALGVCDASDDPVVLSHDGARERYDYYRTKSDRELEAVADNGGVIGIQAAPHNTASAAQPAHSIESVMDHFEYVRDLVGVDHVTFGPDLLYGDHRSLHEQFDLPIPDAAEEIEYVRGMENPTEAWDNIVRYLVTEGYSDEDIGKVLGGNTLRVLEEVWQ